MASYTNTVNRITGPAYDDARRELDEATNRALDALYDGNAQMADAILEGLGLSIEEREKWFSVAQSTLQPWADFGMGFMPDIREMVDMSKEAMKYSQDLIMNPDAIYDSNAWKAHKDVVVDAIQNSASAKSDLLGGNTMAAIADRVGASALQFRTNEIKMAQDQSNTAGGNAARVHNMAFAPSSSLATAATGVGNQNANAISNAYNALGASEQLYGQNLSNLYLNHAGQNIDLTLGQAQNTMNSALIDQANDRYEQQMWMNLFASMFGAGTYG